MFSTKLKKAGIDSETRAQFDGHIRVSSEIENRYSKDHPQWLYMMCLRALH